MVSLAIAETYSCPKDPVDEADLLRNNALWFPEIPERYLHLNETCFTGIDTPASEFQPLCYILFGGSGVANFQFLTKISVLSQGSCIMVIDFHYDTSNIRRLGCQYHQLSAYNTSDFLINGAQGEVIETIEVDLDISPDDDENMQSFWKHGRLRSFRVSGCSHGILLKLRSRRSLPIEDDRNICEASRTR
jgi:hypothetical protein